MTNYVLHVILGSPTKEGGFLSNKTDHYVEATGYINHRGSDLTIGIPDIKVVHGLKGKDLENAVKTLVDSYVVDHNGVKLPGLVNNVPPSDITVVFGR